MNVLAQIYKKRNDYSLIKCRFQYIRNSPKIAPARFRTKGWEWRDALKKDDRVDIFDTIGNWFLGTVVNVRALSGKNIKEIFVGYRIYSEDGTKLDNMGKKHEGWSESYDEWIPAYSLRLQQ